MNSVLHAALVAPFGYSNEGMMKGFLGAGFTTYHSFDYQKEAYERGGKPEMCAALIKEAERLKPDMIFLQVQMSDWVDLETFKRLSEIAFTVNYTFDIRSKEQTEWLYEVTKHIGLTCFSNQRDVNECHRRGIRNAMVLQSSVDMDVYKQREIDMDGDDEFVTMVGREGVVFVGNNFMNTNHEFPLSAERQIMVSHLQSEFGDRFKVYGNNWNGSKLIPQKEEVGIYQKALIAIAHNNFDEELYTSDRIWRIMATGTFCLTKYFKGIEKLFERGVHLDWWSSLSELGNALTYYLTDAGRTLSIARQGMEHVRKNHTWEARINEMMSFVRTMKKLPSPDACREAHTIDGIIPEPTDQQFDGRVCDCGKLRFSWVECGCVLKEYQLRAEQNI